jgi:hypothetical protein
MIIFSLNNQKVLIAPFAIKIQGVSERVTYITLILGNFNF